MRIILPYILFILLSFSSQGQIVNIPDANFKTALLNHVPVINTNGDGEIQVSEALAFMGDIVVSGKNISDLTGIEVFVNIERLYCDFNKLTSLTFSNFTRLTTLDCHLNQLTTLNISNLPVLETLTCYANFLITLPLNNISSVKYLACNRNKLTSLIFDNSFALVDLDCSTNMLTTLILPNVSILRTFNCYDNLISSLTIGDAPQLQKISCNKNKLASLNIGSAPLLTELLCYTNSLTSLTLGNLPSLQILWCYANKLTSLSLTNVNALKSLDCHTNKLTKLSFSDYPSLATIDCYNNNLDSITLTNLPAFVSITSSQNHLYSVTLNNLPKLPELDIRGNQLTYLTISSLPKLRILHVENNRLTSVSLSNLPVLKYFDCTGNLLTTLDLSQTAVENLRCSNNTNLQYINIKNGTIIPYTGYLTLTGLPALQTICADDAEINLINTVIATQLPGQTVPVSSFCNFNPDGNYNTIIGTLRFDRSSDGCNNLDSSMYNVKIKMDNDVQNEVTFTNMQGNYKFFPQQNPNTVTPELSNPYFTITPPSYTINFTGFGNTQIADFCIIPNGIHPDLDITLLPITNARPGFDAQYRLVYRNKGNQVQSGTVNLSFEAAKLNFVSSTPNTTGQTTGNLVWSFAELSPFETRAIILVLHVNTPPVVNIGDTLSFTAVINPIEGDETPADNTFAFEQVVRGSYDPNDKQVTEGSATDISRAGDYLHYIIRFQNTGNESAISVVIKDYLSDNLDWSSFVPISASHSYRAVVTKGNQVEFIFDGINLPGKTMDEPGSHGYVAFKIKPKGGITIGETIYNKADINFDYNLPVVTNTVSTTIVNFSKTSNTIGLTVYPNPAKDHVLFTVNQGVQIKSFNLYNGPGGKIYSENVVNSSNPRKINITNLPDGILFLEVISDQGKAIQKVIKLK